VKGAVLYDIQAQKEAGTPWAVLKNVEQLDIYHVANVKDCSGKDFSSGTL
jgi:hypothetical protein